MAIIAIGTPKPECLVIKGPENTSPVSLGTFAVHLRYQYPSSLLRRK
jgi:hypothetical protein